MRKGAEEGRLRVGQKDTSSFFSRWNRSAPLRSAPQPPLAPPPTPGRPLSTSRRTTSQFGLETYIFNARRPVRERAFLKLLRKGPPRRHPRQRGFYWTDRKPERVGLVSIAGDTLPGGLPRPVVAHPR